MDPIGTVPVGDAMHTAVNYLFSVGADFAAFLVVAALAGAFGFYFGRDRLVALIAGVYAAMALFVNFPYSAAVGTNSFVIIGIFVAMVALATVAFAGLSSYTPGSGGFFQTLGLSVLTAGLVLAVAVHMAPIQEVYSFSNATISVFQPPQYYFWWLVAPLVGAFLFSN